MNLRTLRVNTRRQYRLHKRFARERFIDVYFESLRPIKVIMVPVMFLASIGFIHMLGDSPSYSMALMLKAAPAWFWALLIGGLAIARLFHIFTPYGNRYTQLVVPILSIWVWFVLFLSNIWSPFNFPSDGMYTLYLAPIGVEFWILGRVFHDNFFGIWDNYVTPDDRESIL